MVRYMESSKLSCNTDLINIIAVVILITTKNDNTKCIHDILWMLC